MYHKNCPKNGTDCGPIRVEVPAALDYAGMADYIKAKPEKLVEFVADRLCDDDFRPFAVDLYDYIVNECGGRPLGRS